MVSKGILGSERVAVHLVSSDVQMHVLTEGVIPMLPHEQLRVVVAGVGDAVLVEVVTHARVHQVEQSCGCCVRGCACCDGMYVRHFCCGRRIRRLRRRVMYIIGKPVATDEGDSATCSMCVCARTGSDALSRVTGCCAASTMLPVALARGVLRVERLAVEGEVRASAVMAGSLPGRTVEG